MDGNWRKFVKIFLKSLRTRFNMSKVHYEAEFKNIPENKQEVQKSKGLCSITLDGIRRGRAP